MIIIQQEKYNTEKYNTHVQREVELSPPEFLMIEKGPKQQFIDIRPIQFNLILQYHLWKLQIRKKLLILFMYTFRMITL